MLISVFTLQPPARGRRLRGSPGALGFAALANLLLGVGCLGEIAGGSAENAAGDPPSKMGMTGGSGGQTAGSGGRGGTGGTPACNAVARLDAVPPRLLTAREYNNTVRDLLGDTSSPAKSWLPQGQSTGFDNSVFDQVTSLQHVDLFLDSAERVATAAVERLAQILPCDAVAKGEQVCADMFIDSFVRRAFRRPVATDERTRVAALYAKGRQAGGFKAGIRHVIAAALQSPHFLYRVERPGTHLPGRPGLALVSGHELAARLSYFLWGTTPDDELLAAADAGRLGTTEQIEMQARRMLADPRGRERLRDVADDFHSQWLQLAVAEAGAKDPKLFPGYDGRAVAGATRAFVKHVVVDSEQGSFGELLTANYVFANASTARILGVTEPKTSAYQKVVLPEPARRAGLLTDLSFLGGVGGKGDGETNPVGRGLFVREHFLCQPLEPPTDPELAELLSPPPPRAPGVTLRQHLETAHSAKNPTCAGCHKMIDGVGFGFEKYDAVGAYREKEGTLDINDRAELVATDVDGPYTGAVELARKLGASGQVRACVTEHWFRYAMGRFQHSEEECGLKDLGAKLAGSGFKLRDLLASIVQTESFRMRAIEPAGACTP